MDPAKVTALLAAMTEVHKLCRELGMPEILDMEAATTVVRACVERGPEVVKLTMLSAFEGADSIQ
jgi:hypothetical protein